MNRERQFGKEFERHHSDKGVHNYAAIYGSLPSDINSVLELGVYWGGSLITWADMFPLADPIYGVDINLELLRDDHSSWFPLEMNENPRIHLIEADLRSFDPTPLPEFDLIIDDGTHELEHMLAMWDKLKSKAKRFYIIEDVYTSRVLPLWGKISSDCPKAQLMFWRTSDHCGDDRLLPDSDSQCLVVKF